MCNLSAPPSVPVLAREEGPHEMCIGAFSTFAVSCTSCSLGSVGRAVQDKQWLPWCPVRNCSSTAMDPILLDHSGDSLTSVTSSKKLPLSRRQSPSKTNAFCCIRLMDNTACSSFYLCNYSFPLRACLPLPSLPPLIQKQHLKIKVFFF